jgi:hypothetical protein
MPEQIVTIQLINGYTLKVPAAYAEEIEALNSYKLPCVLKKATNSISNATLTPDYYNTVSHLGAPLLALLDFPILDTCRMTIENANRQGASFYICSTIKYLWRLGNKGGLDKVPLDLLKVITNLTWELESATDSAKKARLEVLKAECSQLLNSFERIRENFKT